MILDAVHTDRSPNRTAVDSLHQAVLCELRPPDRYDPLQAGPSLSRDRLWRCGTLNRGRPNIQAGMTDTHRRQLSGILFDVGGVLVALDGVPALAKLLAREQSDDAIYEMWASARSVVAHETGKISATEFAQGFVADLNLAVTPEAFLQDFITWPRSVHPGVFDLLAAIPSAYRVAALSNTSKIHWDRVTAMGLAQRFEQVYLSHEMGHVKPSREAYEIALDGMNLRPEDVLFLDDSPRNVDAARNLGMEAQLARNADEARSVLEEYGLLPERA